MKCASNGICRMNVWPLAIAVGVAEAFCMMVLAWGAWQFTFGDSAIQLVATVYPGFEASLIGGLWGALWGFIDGFVFGLIVAVVYNCCARCCCIKK